MSATTVSNLRLKAINRHRTRLFGNSSLTVHSMTPAGKSAAEGTFSTNWFAHRVWETTDQGVKEATAWQFQIVAAADWTTSQAFMKKAAVLDVGTESWKVVKVQKPVGNSLVWKVKAQQIQ